ncbi:unnamed protein product [Nezara viridula]|uniref:Uncharacterized protein n=1 Tax=Nezara viridula TaxID=85310 RepID=A0A9P0MUT5_NEZVI|nr:unnamed protein product [Nezara viridula]
MGPKSDASLQPGSPLAPVRWPQGNVGSMSFVIGARRGLKKERSLSVLLSATCLLQSRSYRSHDKRICYYPKGEGRE